LINNDDEPDLLPTFRFGRPKTSRCRGQATLPWPRKDQDWQGRFVRRRRDSYVRKQNAHPSCPSELTHDLYLFAAGLPSKENTSRRAETSTETSGTATTTPSDSTTTFNGDKYVRRLNEYKAGQSPTTFHPSRTRTFQPGLSWLGDDEFESTGLAFKLARHHMQRVAAGKKSNPGWDESANRNANPGSGHRRNDQGPRIRTKTSHNAEKNTSRPRKELTKNPRSEWAPNTSLSTEPDTSYQTLKPSPAPLRVDLESTDFTSLFGAPPSLSVSPSPTSTKITPADNASSRAQLALEQHGGDYSNLVSGSLVTSQGSPIVYAKSTMARRRDLGPDKRDAALGIIQGMIGKPQDSRPTA